MIEAIAHISQNHNFSVLYCGEVYGVELTQVLLLEGRPYLIHQFESFIAPAFDAFLGPNSSNDCRLYFSFRSRFSPRRQLSFGAGKALEQ